MRLPIAYLGNPVLRKKCKPVQGITKDVQELVQNLIDTMEAENGIGLAAPQISSTLRVFVTCVPKYLENGEVEPGIIRVFINPEILSVSQETIAFNEGCISVPGIRGKVERPFMIRVKALNFEGQEFIEEYQGLEAVCILHENDHINGVLFFDRIHGKERDEMEPILKEIKKNFSKKPDSKK
ncbi:peptide deformylase [Criblamydia sequanensis]|uniref:Peptide deformylase n=1 Tax=Candidatus Criblamydia sequanensis CRIB-18 TaxID=1437425 RepID=A0A090D0W9_9BACT|nr:peptide deformylase [Criblamydia sequanensis]CDR35197.1 Peptide deformylase [Criblamydia sequanensis CRIB-18]